MAPRAVLMKTGLRPLNTARLVNTAHHKTTVHSARPMLRFSKSAQSTVKRPYQGHPQKEDQGYVNSGCSRHMTGNMSYFSDFKEYDGGYVTFRGGANGGEKLRVSQMCDKKNSVLFTEAGCFVLSPDFKLADESQVLLKVPRKNNMYIVDMKNIVPKECLTCLVAKATLKESMLWHRRLGHVNFKNINKLVKENLVRGLPAKRFENDQTCVACLKGKQHKASSSKDETSGILKSFITEIENQIDKKVKIIICDNGTEFKNKVMNEFYEMKGIKREFSNRVLVVKPHNKTPYELFRGRTPALSFMRPFRCHVSILNTLDHLGKFDGKLDEGFFIGYSLNSTNSKDFVGTEESIGAGHSSKETVSSKDYILMPLWKDGEIDNQEIPESSTQDFNIAGPSINTASRNVNTSRLTINTVSPTVTTAPLEATHADFFGDELELDMSNITTTYLVPSTLNTRIHKDHSLDHAISDVKSGIQIRRMTRTTNEQGFISAVYKGKTHEDLHTCLFTCFLSQEEPKKVIQALKDPSWIEAINKARLVAQGYTQEEGIDNGGGFLRPVASIEAIRWWSMGVEGIEEEVYVCQPPGFEDPKFPDRVYKVEKALYGLHQAPRAWVKGDILLVQVYVDDIIFGSTKKEICTEFEKIMHKRFQMSSMGELTFFLGLQTASTPMETSKPLLKDAEAKDVDVHLYRLMIGSLMYLTTSRPDIMFTVCACARFQVTPKVSHLHVVKRIFRYLKVANSTTEAKYVAATSCCGQVLWIQNQMLDYGYNFMNTKIFIDNESTIYIVKNTVFHSKTKNIEIGHHFIRDSNEKKLIQMIKIHTDQNVADLLTKAFDVSRFQNLIASIGMLNP
ncbi:putative ribonuclease H-like domain-containing protein [Tanacetum coccineum]